MTPLFPAQRAAEEFERVLSGTAEDAVARQYAELLEAVEQLRALPEVTPRAEFVGDLRTRLMTAAETELAPVARTTPRAVPSLPEERARRSRRRLGTIAASLVVVGGTAGMAAASSGALPGETLYPIKRGIEQVTTAAHLGDAAQGRAQLGQAATRLEEVRALQAQGNPDPDLVAETMDAFRTEADSGSQKLFASYQASGDQADITSVRDFASRQMTDVTAMSSVADTATSDLLLAAADTLVDIDQQAQVLCGLCAPGTKPVTPPNAFSAGAGAEPLSNLVARPVTQAQADVQLLNAATAARIKALKVGAEEQAAKIPLVQTGVDKNGNPTFKLPGSGESGNGPLTSVVTPDGKLLPTLTSGAAVTDLVSGVTTTLDSATNGATDPLTKPLDDAVKKVGEELGGVTDGLLP